MPSTPPVKLGFQLAVSGVGDDVLLPAALCGEPADVEHEVGPFHTLAIGGPRRPTLLAGLAAHLALLQGTRTLSISVPEKDL